MQLCITTPSTVPHSTGPLLQERAPIKKAERACLVEIPGNASLQAGISDSLHKTCARRRRTPRQKFPGALRRR